MTLTRLWVFKYLNLYYCIGWGHLNWKWWGHITWLTHRHTRTQPFILKDIYVYCSTKIIQNKKNRSPLKFIELLYRLFHLTFPQKLVTKLWNLCSGFHLVSWLSLIALVLCTKASKTLWLVRKRQSDDETVAENKVNKIKYCHLSLTLGRPEHLVH